MRARALIAAVTSVLLAGTTVARGGHSAPREGAPPVASAAPDMLVLQIRESHSGPAPWELGRLAGFSLYGGGRVVVPGESAGALQTAREFPLSGREYERIMTDARAVGLGLLPDTPRGAREFRPTALAVLATGGVSAGSTPATPWPLHPLGEGTWTREGRCTVLTGDALTQARRLARNARQDSRWTSGGTLYAVSFRPLLPDEHTCQDLDAR